MNIKLSPHDFPGAGQAGSSPTNRGKDFEQAKRGQNPPSTAGTTPPPAPAGGPSTGQRPPGWSYIHIHIVTGLIASSGVNAIDDAMLDMIDLLTDRLLARYPGYIEAAGQYANPPRPVPGR